MLCFLLGFLIVFGAVGSIELAVDNTTVMLGIMIASFGLAIMVIGTESVRD